jgi:hypothetical protein
VPHAAPLRASSSSSAAPGSSPSASPAVAGLLPSATSPSSPSASPSTRRLPRTPVAPLLADLAQSRKKLGSDSPASQAALWRLLVVCHDRADLAVFEEVLAAEAGDALAFPTVAAFELYLFTASRARIASRIFEAYAAIARSAQGYPAISVGLVNAVMRAALFPEDPHPRSRTKEESTDVPLAERCETVLEILGDCQGRGVVPDHASFELALMVRFFFVFTLERESAAERVIPSKSKRCIA